MRRIALGAVGAVVLSLSINPGSASAAVAALPWVATIRPAVRPQTDVGPVSSEGAVLHRADRANRIGITGRGQKVGAMSDGVTSLAAAQAQGELPAVQVIDAGEGDEGTGMLEIVHDSAPGAALAFSGTGETLEDHVAGLRALAAAGSTIITEDLAFDDEPAFQQGLTATTAERLALGGVFFSSSAGNLGARHTPRVPAVGTGTTPDGLDPAAFGDRCGPGPRNAVAVAGGTDTSFDLRLGANGLLLATLQWSEPRAIYPTVGQGGFTDVNLYLLEATTGRCLAYSTATQANGVGDSIEQVLYDSAELGAQTNQLKLVVDVAGTSSAVAPPTIDLRWRTGIAGSAAVDAPARAGSLNPDSNYLYAATSAGAADAGLSTDPKAVPLEAFSAGGPVQVGSTTRCPLNRPGPCKGVAGGGFRTALAPTWVAGDGISISGAGGFPDPSVCPTTETGVCQFFGTSAAAPSAAGVAALVRQELGGRLAPLLLNPAMAALAVDRGDPGRDNTWGAGVLRVLPV